MRTGITLMIIWTVRSLIYGEWSGRPL